VNDTRLLVPENLNINGGFFHEVLPVRNKIPTLTKILVFNP